MPENTREAGACDANAVAADGEVECEVDESLHRRDLLVNNGKCERQIWTGTKPRNCYKETASAGGYCTAILSL